MSRPTGARLTPDRGGDDVAAVDALDALARARSRARDRGERFTDLYVWAFCGVLMVVWALSFARQTFTGQVCASGDGAGCVLQQHPTYAGLAVALAGAGALVLAAGAAGPVSAERALARWLLTTTAERSVLLRGSLVGVVTGTALGGVAVGLLASMAAQGGGLEPAPLGAGALVGAAVGALVPLVLVRPQAARPYGDAPGSRVGATLVVVGLALLAWLVVAVPAHGLTGGLTQLSVPVDVVVAAGAVTAATALLVFVATLRTGGVLAHLSDRQLARGREVVDAVADSTVMLDGSMLTGLQRRRADRARGRHSSRRLWGRGAVAFVVADLRQVRRRWRTLLPAVLLVPGLLVVGEGFGYGGVVLGSALAAAWVGRREGQGLRVWLGSGGLRRTVRAPAWSVTAALTVAPVAACVVVTIPVVVLVGGPWWAGLHLAVAGLASTMRSADPPPLEVGAVVTTPAGALPTGLVVSALHGPDLALVLGVALLLVGTPWVLCLSAAALVWQVTRDR